MVLVPANAANSVPRVGLVAQKALFHSHLLLAGDGPVHHLEMHHVIAWRCLVALNAAPRAWRGVRKPAYCPGRGGVATLAVAAEQRPVRVAVGMAALNWGGQRQRP